MIEERLQILVEILQSESLVAQITRIESAQSA